MSRILLAEPDPAVRRLMAAWLPRYGHTIRTTERGLELVPTLRRDPPDVLVAAVGGLGGCGLGLAEAVRAISDVPIVLTSGAWSPERQARAAAIGAGVVQKPFDMAALAAWLVYRPDEAGASAGPAPEKIDAEAPTARSCPGRRCMTGARSRRAKAEGGLAVDQVPVPGRRPAVRARTCPWDRR